jgi:3-phosphoglycerate kinase
MLQKKTVEDVSLSGKKVLMRVDFNVPLDAGLNITDDSRIRAALPTIQYILDQGAALILMSHLGRPKGEPDPAFSLKPAAARLAELVAAPVTLAPDCIGEQAAAAAAALRPGAILMLENLRFHSGEKKNDPEFAKQLASLADVYVNDAFGAAHRAHASTDGVTRHMSPCVAGFLMKKEIEYLENAIANPQRPFVAVLGGVKVSDKIMVIERLLDRVDTLLIGGAMAYTFLKSMGYEMGQSKLEPDFVDEAARLMALARDKGKQLMLPVDLITADRFAEDAEVGYADAQSMPADRMGMGIGPRTIEAYARVIAGARTLVWNGPMGVFEMKAFAEGTRAIAAAIGDNPQCTSIICGGDSAAAVKIMGLDGNFTHISTGGGASLEMLEGKILPGLAALDDA